MLNKLVRTMFYISMVIFSSNSVAASITTKQINGETWITGVKNIKIGGIFFDVSFNKTWDHVFTDKKFASVATHFSARSTLELDKIIRKTLLEYRQKKRQLNIIGCVAQSMKTCLIYTVADQAEYRYRPDHHLFLSYETSVKFNESVTTHLKSNVFKDKQDFASDFKHMCLNRPMVTVASWRISPHNLDSDHLFIKKITSH